MRSPTASKTGKAVNKMRWRDKENTLLLWKWSIYGILGFSREFGEMTSMLVTMYNSREQT